MDEGEETTQTWQDVQHQSHMGLPLPMEFEQLGRCLAKLALRLQANSLKRQKGRPSWPTHGPSSHSSALWKNCWTSIIKHYIAVYLISACKKMPIMHYYHARPKGTFKGTDDPVNIKFESSNDWHKHIEVALKQWHVAASFACYLPCWEDLNQTVCHGFIDEW